jgi:uncharacterized protein YuzE
MTYDKEADALYIRLSDAPVHESGASSEHVVLDYDATGNLVGIELLYFLSKHKKELFPVFKMIEEAVWLG